MAIRNVKIVAEMEESRLEDNEIWRKVKGFEGLYEVSSFGNVRSLNHIIFLDNGGSYLKQGKILKPKVDKYGYLTVTLCKKSFRKIFKVHRLVALTFLENPNNYPQVNHKDENKQNNHIDNLEWCSAIYNNTYGSRNERISNSHIGIGKGKKLSDETKLKMSMAHSKPSGRITSKETKRKISDSLKKYYVSRKRIHE